MIPEYIIVHHSLTEDGQTVSWGAIRKYHMEVKGWDDIGYHVGIELIGDTCEVLLGRMWDQAGAHTVGMNGKSIGICVIGNYDASIPSDAHMKKLVEVTRFVMHLFNIPADKVKRHSDYASKSCPGNLFPWDQFKAQL